MAINLKTQLINLDEGGIGLYLSSTSPIGFRYLLQPGEDPSEALLPAHGEWMGQLGCGFPQRARDRLRRSLLSKIAKAQEAK